MKCEWDNNKMKSLQIYEENFNIIKSDNIYCVGYYFWIFLILPAMFLP